MLQEQQLIAGLTPSRLKQLCQPESIERTMHLLFSLNHWAKARERLFYADRKGLYAVKATVLREAYLAGGIRALAYIDGIEGFGSELTFDLAVDIATEAFFWRLEDLLKGPAVSDLHDQIALQLYQRITGQTTLQAEDLARLEPTTVEAYLHQCLDELEREARLTRQPIPWRKLMELCIAPSDFLAIEDRRYYELGGWNSWEQLDSSDLHKLDPEGLSLIAFHFTSPGAHYVFHLPLRLAEEFLPMERLHALKAMPTSSREHGEYYGRAITPLESLQQPVGEILQEMEVHIPAVCPRQLSDKQDYVFRQALRSIAWSEALDLDEEDEDELDNDSWLEKELSEGMQTDFSCLQQTCPHCNTKVIDDFATARFDHWMINHADQDLTFSQVSWLLRQKLQKKPFCHNYPPDYRSPQEDGYGTRYWRLTTLAPFMRKHE